jgi:NAD(P)-dependent dehydrogenase (short-subunit alcohol dehydrogenase family)
MPTSTARSACRHVVGTIVATSAGRGCVDGKWRRPDVGVTLPRMNDLLGYEGKHVVVTGAASGMGEQVARICHELGATVTALDLKPVSTPVKTSLTLDLLDQASIDGVVAEIDGPVDSVFSCAGLPGPPFTDLQTATVNFIGARQLIEGLLPKMAEGASISCIASGAGVGWQQELETFAPLLATETFADAVAWCEENAEVAFPFGGYRMSKVVVNQYVAKVCATYGERGVRINCLNPGPTATAMMPAFEENAGKATIENALGVIHRYSQPEEQAWPMVCLNSPRFSYVTGEALWVDGGFLAMLSTGSHPGFAMG